MSIETKQCSICVDAPPYRNCPAWGTDECAFILALQAALREALDGWEESETWMGRHADDKSFPRIAELRKFLDDK